MTQNYSERVLLARLKEGGEGGQSEDPKKRVSRDR